MTNMETNTVTTNDVGSNKKATEVEAVARLYNDCDGEAKTIIAKIVRQWQTRQSVEEQQGIKGI